ncbi:MAG: hypothetical protein ABIQ61_10145 [Ornithinibacter sp.]
MPAVTAKKKCCKDKPRCKKCPVVLMRLERLGHAERDGKRSYIVDKTIPKKAMQLARAR